MVSGRALRGAQTALGTSALRQGAEDRTQVAWSVDLALKVHGFHFLGEYISDYSELVDVAGDPGASSQGAAVPSETQVAHALASAATQSSATTRSLTLNVLAGHSHSSMPVASDFAV